jgi:3-hydroxybutyryl-CoA dehydrogenase
MPPCTQAVSESLSLKQRIFKGLAAEIQPKAILATNTSSISITKIAATVVPEGQAAASEEGKKAAGRVVGEPLSLRFFFFLARDGKV